MSVNNLFTHGWQQGREGLANPVHGTVFSLGLISGQRLREQGLVLPLGCKPPCRGRANWVTSRGHLDFLLEHVFLAFVFSTGRVPAWR